MPAALPARVRFVACDALLFGPHPPVPGLRSDPADLRAEMARLRIRAAVVRHGACATAAPAYGNAALLRALRGQPGLIPAWCLTPEGEAPGFHPEAAVRRMLAAGVRIAWMDPQAHAYPLRPGCAGRLLAALEAGRVPLLLAYDTLDLGHLEETLRSFPALRVILHTLPRLGRHRVLWPLLERFPSLHLCFGPSFSMHGGFAALCREFGIRRWVWGMGYPAYEGGAAVTGLMYAGLTPEALSAVAHGTLERLLKEVAA